MGLFNNLLEITKGTVEIVTAPIDIATGVVANVVEGTAEVVKEIKKDITGEK